MRKPRQLRLVVSRDAILCAASCGEWQPVYGISRGFEGLIQVLSSKAQPVRCRTTRTWLMIANCVQMRSEKSS